jgi:hypothetical protein
MIKALFNELYLMTTPMLMFIHEFCGAFAFGTYEQRMQTYVLCIGIFMFNIAKSK